MSPRLVLPIHAGPPPEPPYGGLGEAGWSRGVTFFEFATQAAASGEALEAAFRDLTIGPALAAFLAGYPRRVRILALADVTQPTSRTLVAQAERCCTASPNLWMRIFAPGACPDLVQRYAPAGEPLPRFVCFGTDQREFARWGPESGGASAFVPAVHALLAEHRDLGPR